MPFIFPYLLPLLAKSESGEGIFLKSLWMSGRIGVRQWFRLSLRVQVGYSPGMQENRSEMFRGFNIFIAWGNPECPWKRFRWLTLFGFDLQITASSPEPGTQTPHSCKSKLLLPQLSQPLVLLNGAVRSWHSKKSSAGWGTSGATATNCLNQRVRLIFFVCDESWCDQWQWQRDAVGKARNTSQIAAPWNAA